MLPFLQQLTLERFLSFGSRQSIALAPLNVLLGPNGSGKSNLIEAMSVLRAVPKDLPLPIREGGGVSDWLWQDDKRKAASSANIEAVFSPGMVTTGAVRKTAPAIRYRLAFGAKGDAFTVLDERIENEKPADGETKPFFYFGFENGRPMLNIAGGKRELRREDIDPTQSILSQRRDPDTYPEITQLAHQLGRIAIYRQWNFGPDSPLRRSCRADVRTDILSEQFDNLPARLMVLRGNPAVKRRLVELLSEIAPGFDDAEVDLSGGQLQLFLTEGSRTFPARRLSDGTLRFLCLLAILLDPNPPPLVAIEEPELGLHPDVLPTIRDLLIDASSRCQLVVTTHSSQLIDAMTDYADSILVAHKERGETTLRRLTQAEVDDNRQFGGLGSLWMTGHFGGTRW